MKKNGDDWAAALLAESGLPADEFTWTEGSNYGLDGFDHLQTENEGVLDGGQGAMHDTVMGMSEIPDEMLSSTVTEDDVENALQDENEGFHLGSMMYEGSDITAEEKREAALADLDWLHAEQDPDRLPRDSRGDHGGISTKDELEAAWGAGHRTDGLRLIPNKDLEVAQHEQSLSAVPGVDYKTAAEVTDALQRAIRRSTYGNPLKEIQAELREALGPDSPRTAKALEMLAADHYLNGAVFVRASVFPGIKNGRWVQKLKKCARTARYVITDDPSVAAKLSMTMVSEVPWRQALAYYRPRLVAGGYKLASKGDPKALLQAALAAGPERKVHQPGWKPVDVRPADHVTAQDARKAFKAAQAPEQVVVASDGGLGVARKAALARIARWVLAGHITQAEAMRLKQSSATPAKLILVAEALVSTRNMAKSSDYEGLGTMVTAHRGTSGEKKVSQEEVDAFRMAAAHKQVQLMQGIGMVTAKEAASALKGRTAAEVMQRLAAIVQQAGQRRQAEPKANPVNDYEGTAFKASRGERTADKTLSASEQQLLQAAGVSGIKLTEFRKLSTWLRRQMSEGMAGSQLDQLLRVRFASPLRTAAAEIITALRTQHEGLAGHLYVDAEAYASPKGITGCEKGALEHRANNIQFVKAMGRCSGCKLANSGGVCTKYNKPLLHGLPRNAAALKQEILRQADAPDHEITADLFSNPAEAFGLTAMTDHFDLNASAPPSEELGDVLFGGFEV
jgi:hypothetical protein